MRLALLILTAAVGGCTGEAAGAADLGIAPPALGSCDDNADAGAALDRLPPASLAALLAARDPYLINVHIPWAGDIPGTDARIAYTDVDAIEAAVGHAHCAEIVLYCFSGGMSVKAGNELIARGYGRVRDLLGGTQAWEAEGHPLEH